MTRSHGLEARGGGGVVADGQLACQAGVAQDGGHHGRRDADRRDGFSGLEHLPHEARHLRVHGALRPRHGEVAEVLGRPEPARKHQGVDLPRPEAREVHDVAAGDAGGLDQNVARLTGLLAADVVDDVHLLHIGGRADDLGTGPIEGQERQDGLVDLGAVEDTAA